MRYQNIKTADPEVLRIISKNFEKLKQLCGYRTFGCYCAMSYEDFFQDTILVVASDANAKGLSEQELINFFVYRFKRTEFQYISDSKMEKSCDHRDGVADKEDLRQFNP